jgi:hypothetical protein
MSTYEIGAFEALEWAWNILRLQENIGEIDAKSQIKEMLFKLGSGNPVDFKRQINDIRTLA